MEGRRRTTAVNHIIDCLLRPLNVLISLYMQRILNQETENGEIGPSRDVFFN